MLLGPFFELPDMRKVEKAIAFKRVLFEHPDRKLYAYYWVMAGFSPAFLEENFAWSSASRSRGSPRTDLSVSTRSDGWWVRALGTNWIDPGEIAG